MEIKDILICYFIFLITFVGIATLIVIGMKWLYEKRKNK